MKISFLLTSLATLPILSNSVQRGGQRDPYKTNDGNGGKWSSLGVRVGALGLREGVPLSNHILL